MTKYAALVTLGCDKNRVDSERILYQLRQAGYSITTDPDRADVLVVNTCAFIESARAESVDAILQLATHKRPGARLIVTGCLTQRYVDPSIVQDLPEVDAFLGVDASAQVVSALQRLQQGQSGFVDTTRCPQASQRILSTPPHYAYLKIADGCNNGCAYCTIPSIRGAYVSRPLDSLVAEATALVSGGVRELILVAQDVTRYGSDLGANALPELLEALGDIPGLACLRLLYCYPELVTDRLIDLVANHPRIARYIDIPMQHISDNILRAMRRRTTYQSTCQLVERIRHKSPDIAIRTTFMVGFPGETQSDFELLCDFVRHYRLEHLGIFAYSREQGTLAARLPDQVPAQTKRQRVDTLGAIHLANVLQHNASLVGRTLEVVHEGVDYDRSMWVGRTQHNAPEVDNLVFFSGNDVCVGRTYRVRITGYDQYDLIGEL